jgi:hypothetical protein
MVGDREVSPGLGALHGRSNEADEDAALEAALHEVPRGALALSGLTVGLLLLAWLLMYALVFLPRGMVS